MAPSKEYLFRLDQPARKIPSGERLDTATRKITPDGRFTGARPAPNGITARTRKEETRINTGAKRWTHWSADFGTMLSLVSSLMASAIGWRRPSGPTRFGPMRS